MFKIGSEYYRMLFLDTNAIREISANSNYAFRGFTKKFFTGSERYAPCFSIYNVVELWSNEENYNLFLNIFSSIPCFMFFPIQSILDEEFNRDQTGHPFQFNGHIANAFIPNSVLSSSNMRSFLNAMRSSGVSVAIENKIGKLKLTAEAWEQTRHKTYQRTEKDFRELESSLVLKDLVNFGYLKPINSFENFPSLRIMEYSQYCRVHLSHAHIKANDVMDVELSHITPYMDAIITESFQSNVLKKAKSFIPQLNNLEIYTLRDIREPNT